MKSVLFVLCNIFLFCNVGISQTNGFIIKGKIINNCDSIFVSVVDIENGQYKTLASCITLGTKFCLQGKVASPLLCELCFQKKGKDNFYHVVPVRMFIENTVYRVRVPSWEQLEKKVEYSGLRELMIKIDGGKGQSELNEYVRSVINLEQILSEKRNALFYGKARECSDDSLQILKEAEKKAMSYLHAANTEFVKQHPNYMFSAYLTQKELNTYFKYTNKEQKERYEWIKNTRDTARFKQMKRALPDILKYSLLQKYEDFDVETIDGQKKKLSEFVKNDKYTLLDFWASWCGPCRSALPHVRNLFSKYAKILNVFNVSIDEKRNEWKKALKEENMNWQQFWLSKESFEKVSADYKLSAIPYLVLINPQGEIVCVTSSIEEIESQLKNR